MSKGSWKSIWRITCRDCGHVIHGDYISMTYCPPCGGPVTLESVIARPVYRLGLLFFKHWEDREGNVLVNSKEVVYRY